MSNQNSEPEAHCHSCLSPRLAFINGKCSDMCQFYVFTDDRERNGYAPENVGIGGRDYIEFTYCLNCGKIQGEAEDTFPVADEAIEAALGGD